MVGIGERIEQVQKAIAAACLQVGRALEEVTIVAVSKGVSVDRIQEAVDAGLTELGENRVQEALEKKPLLKGVRKWHGIGSLQRNKVRLAVELFDVIQSVDRLELIDSLERAARELSRKPELFLQVNVSGEASKHGCRIEEAEGLAGKILAGKALNLTGLMTMAPFSEDPEQARPVFRRLKALKTDLERKCSLPPLKLSMGMSQDFEVAVQEGATLVRIGTALFGER